jgi:NADPH:quinone reductase-like Zn-dependent oxidoreductase
MLPTLIVCFFCRYFAVMKALVFEQYGTPEVLQLREVEKPSPGAQQVLVKVRAASINPKDLLVRKGKFRLFTGKRFPIISGYDFAGDVVAKGKEVKQFEIGEPVFGMLGGWRSGTFAEFVAVDVKDIARIPPNISYEEAASVPMAGLAALQGLRDYGRLASGMEVCINGASGGVGTFAVQIAKNMGARVTAVTSYRNIEMVQMLGADATIDYTLRDVLETSQNCHVFFDVFGNKSFAGAKPLLRKSGIYVTTIPSLRNFRDELISYFQLKKSRVVKVRSNVYDLDKLELWVRAFQLKIIIDRIFPLDKAADAHRYLETKRAQGKVVIKIG